MCKCGFDEYVRQVKCSFTLVCKCGVDLRQIIHWQATAGVPVSTASPPQQRHFTILHNIAQFHNNTSQRCLTTEWSRICHNKQQFVRAFAVSMAIRLVTLPLCIVTLQHYPCLLYDITCRGVQIIHILCNNCSWYNFQDLSKQLKLELIYLAPICICSVKDNQELRCKLQSYPDACMHVMSCKCTSDFQQ